MNIKQYIRKAKKNARKLKIGDIITSYYKGYHRITNIIPRTDAAPLVEHITILDSQFNPYKGRKLKTCDASYCIVLTKEEIEKRRLIQIEHFQRGYDILLSHIKTSE
jgi:hypothetical protein